MKKRLSLALLLLVVLTAAAVVADDGTAHSKVHAAEEAVSTGVFYLKIVGGLLLVSTLIILPLKKHLDNTGKKIVFWTISVLVMLSTLYFAGSIIYENVNSVTGGPIHWHADYQIWVCGERVDLVDPNFPKNKIGSPLFHEHDDDRVHVEGTVMTLPNVDLGEYFKVIGGALEQGHMKYPTGEGLVEVSDGDTCSGQRATLQVYVNGQLEENYSDYQFYPDPYVPPGDCIIVEFDSETSQTTDKICSSWAAKEWDYNNYKEKRRQAKVGDYVWQ